MTANKKTMKAFRLPTDKVSCSNGIDKNVLENILDLSVFGTSTYNNLDLMAKAAMAPDFFNFNTYVIFKFFLPTIVVDKDCQNQQSIPELL